LSGALFEWACTGCGAVYARDAVRYLCPSCSASWAPGAPLEGVLEARFDFAAIADRLEAGGRIEELLCAVEPRFHPPFPVGRTPLFPAPRLGAELGLDDLWIKNDGQNPSGSLKDRASFLVVAEAIRLGEETIVAASTGNAASALAAVCAAAGRTAVIYVPRAAPRAKLVQMVLYGADVRLVDGTYDDAFALSIAHTAERGGLNRNTAYHPLTIEGKKTVSLEIAEALGEAPDWVVVPAGDGVIISGVWKGFADLHRLGAIARPPRLVCVQAESSDAIHRYVTTGVYSNAASPRTIADSISVRAPSNAHMAKRAVEESRGLSVTVTDDEILAAQRTLARTTGVFAEPAAAASIAGLEKIRDHVGPGERVVALVTGHGLKDVDAAMRGIEMPGSAEGKR
jgi:threonine synthase